MNLVQEKTIKRVLNMRVNLGNGFCSSGTCFTIEYNDVQYLITAKHVFQALNHPNKATIQISKNDAWVDLNVSVHYHDIENIDIAVMKLVSIDSITPIFSIQFNNNDLFVSQDLFFLGFPFGYKVNSNTNQGYPVPIINKCTLSACINENSTNVFYLDGHNNKGFSGGPVIFNKISENGYISGNIICGVISGYKPYESPLYDQYGKETGHYTKENSGIIVAYRIEHAIEIINGIK